MYDPSSPRRYTVGGLSAPQQGDHLDGSACANEQFESAIPAVAFAVSPGHAISPHSPATESVDGATESGQSATAPQSTSRSSPAPSAGGDMAYVGTLPSGGGDMAYVGTLPSGGGDRAYVGTLPSGGGGSSIPPTGPSAGSHLCTGGSTPPSGPAATALDLLLDDSPAEVGCSPLGAALLRAESESPLIPLNEDSDDSLLPRGVPGGPGPDDVDSPRTLLKMSDPGCAPGSRHADLAAEGSPDVESHADGHGSTCEPQLAGGVASETCHGLRTQVVATIKTRRTSQISTLSQPGTPTGSPHGCRHSGMVPDSPGCQADTPSGSALRGGGSTPVEKQLYGPAAAAARVRAKLAVESAKKKAETEAQEAAANAKAAKLAALGVAPRSTNRSRQASPNAPLTASKANSQPASPHHKAAALTPTPTKGASSLLDRVDCSRSAHFGTPTRTAPRVGASKTPGGVAPSASSASLRRASADTLSSRRNLVHDTSSSPAAPGVCAAAQAAHSSGSRRTPGSPSRAAATPAAPAAVTPTAKPLSGGGTPGKSKSKSASKIPGPSSCRGTADAPAAGGGVKGGSVPAAAAAPGTSTASVKGNAPGKTASVGIPGSHGLRGSKEGPVGTPTPRSSLVAVTYATLAARQSPRCTACTATSASSASSQLAASPRVAVAIPAQPSPGPHTPSSGTAGGGGMRGAGMRTPVRTYAQGLGAEPPSPAMFYSPAERTPQQAPQRDPTLGEPVPPTSTQRRRSQPPRTSVHPPLATPTSHELGVPTSHEFHSPRSTFDSPEQPSPRGGRSGADCTEAGGNTGHEEALALKTHSTRGMGGAATPEQSGGGGVTPVDAASGAQGDKPAKRTARRRTKGSDKPVEGVSAAVAAAMAMGREVQVVQFNTSGGVGAVDVWGSSPTSRENATGKARGGGSHVGGGGGVQSRRKLPSLGSDSKEAALPEVDRSRMQSAPLLQSKASFKVRHTRSGDQGPGLVVCSDGGSGVDHKYPPQAALSCGGASPAPKPKGLTRRLSLKLKEMFSR